MKLTKIARALIKLIALLMLGWIGYVIYGSIIDTGLWKQVVDLLTSDGTGRYSPVGVFSICLIIGFIPLIAIMFFIIWLSNKVSRSR